MASEKLKPCPFCGVAPSVFRRKDENLWNHDIVDWTTITCNECDIKMCWPSSIDEETFAKWNTRPAGTAGEEIVGISGGGVDDDTLKTLKSESVSVRNPEMDTRQIARHYKSDERVLKSDNPGKRKLERDRQT